MIRARLRPRRSARDRAPACSFSESGNGVREMSDAIIAGDAVRLEQAADDVGLDLATACGR